MTYQPPLDSPASHEQTVSKSLLHAFTKKVMIEDAKRWLRRNRTSLTISLGAIGIGYVTTQYVISKFTEARERISGDHLAKENLRRRFQQNQEDCTITVLELLPTVAGNILEALPAEKIAEEIQQKKVQRSWKSAGTSDIALSDLSSGPPSTVDEDSKSSSSFQSKSYVHASRSGTSTSGILESNVPKNKAQLWNELKISSITRCFTLLYTVSLLSLLTRIQLNLLGRRNYLSSVVSLASHPPQDPTISLEDRDDDNVEQARGNDFETNRKYLTFSWWLLHRGWREILPNVESAVRDVFGSRKPNETVSLEQLSGLILDIRRKVEGATPEDRKSRKWLSVLLPPEEQEQSVLREAGMCTSPPAVLNVESQKPADIPPLTFPSSTSATSSNLRRLLDETADLIDSPMFSRVLILLLDATYSQLVDTKLRLEAYKLHPLGGESSPTAKITELTESDPATASTKLATILAVMTREAHKIGNGVPNEYVQATENVSELEGFAAVVYTSNFEDKAGFEVGLTSYSLGSGSGDEAESEERTLGNTSAVEAEKAVQVAEGPGITDGATSIIDAIWGTFAGAWGKVTGKGFEV